MVSLSHRFLTLVTGGMGEVLQTPLRIQWKILIRFSGKCLYIHTTFCTISEVSCVPVQDLLSVSGHLLGMNLNVTETFFSVIR